MNVSLSKVRSSIMGLCVVVEVSAPVVVADAPSAGAALPPVSGCGFRLGAITNQGAAGTVFYSVVLEPNSPAQHCIAVVTFTAAAAIAPQFTSQGPYRNIAHNPLTATEVVGFTPGRIPPDLGLAWGGFHCADPALPGTLRFVVGNQAASVGIDPSTCDGNPFPSSFAPFTPPVVSAVGLAPTLDDRGYRTVDQDGNVTAKGDATPFVFGSEVNAPFVAIQTAATGNGAWIVDAAGHVTTFGSAEFHGDLRDVHLNAPIVGMAATSDGRGYWLDAFDGGVFAFGDANFMGSLGSIVLNAPVVGIAAGPHGGYWLVASDGGVFAFGVPFEGSGSRIRLHEPISGIAATATGAGYWLVGADNGIFSYGDAEFFGSNPFPDG